MQTHQLAVATAEAAALALTMLAEAGERDPEQDEATRPTRPSAFNTRPSPLLTTPADVAGPS